MRESALPAAPRIDLLRGKAVGPRFPRFDPGWAPGNDQRRDPPPPRSQARISRAKIFGNPSPPPPYDRPIASADLLGDDDWLASVAPAESPRNPVSSRAGVVPPARTTVRPRHGLCHRRHDTAVRTRRRVRQATLRAYRSSRDLASDPGRESAGDPAPCACFRSPSRPARRRPRRRRSLESRSRTADSALSLGLRRCKERGGRVLDDEHEVAVPGSNHFHANAVVFRRAA